MPKTTICADDIFSMVDQDVAENKGIVVVFDLDSTLFNVSTRTQQIIAEFAQLAANQSNSPDLLKKLSTVQVAQSDWGLKESLMRVGFELHEAPELFHKLKDFWFQKFFSNEYLHFDVPTQGAVSFVNRLNKHIQPDGELYYLTGRDEHRMGIGTREVLKKWLFPSGTVQLKPHRELEDSKFKLDWTAELVAQKTKSQKDYRVYFFENEPVNLNLIGRTLPNLRLFFLDTTHSRREEVSVPVYELDHFGELD